MKVRAIARGYYGNVLREEDDIFDVKESDFKNGEVKASWFIPLKDAKKIAPADHTVDEVPTTLEEAKKLTNPQLQKLLAEEGIKYPEGATKAEMAKLLIDAQTKAKKAEEGDDKEEDEDDLV